MDEIMAQLSHSERAEKRQKSHSTTQHNVLDRHWIPSLKKWLPGTWSDLPISDRAVKSDDAIVDLSPWLFRIQLVLPWCRARLISFFERLGLRRWRRNITRSFVGFLAETNGETWCTQLTTERQSRRGKRGMGPNSDDVCKRQKLSRNSVVLGESPVGSPYEIEARSLIAELLVDATKGCAVLTQILDSSWWEWSRGSALCFWQWNGPEQVRAATDGMEIFVSSQLPKVRGTKSKMHLSPDERGLVAAKLDTMFHQSYLEEGFVESKVHFFGVPKGEDDIRVVFDGTSSGLNECLWAPSFYLTTSRAASTILTFSTWMADADFGEMFHNFPMPDRIRKSSGVEIGRLVPYLTAPLTVENTASVCCGGRGCS